MNKGPVRQQVMHHFFRNSLADVSSVDRYPAAAEKRPRTGRGQSDREEIWP